MSAKKFVVALCILFWPLNLILRNTHTPNELFTYIVPAGLLLLSFKYYRCRKLWYYIVPILLIPFISFKLALFPTIFFLIHIFIEKRKKHYIIATVTGLIIFFVSWTNFYGQTIFIPDYEQGQKVIRDQQLYPTPLTARIFHNKARIVIDKANDNFFAISDPNNYFFGFAPRQIVENQNLQKFPFLGLPFLLFGLFKLGKLKERNFVITSIVAGLISLSILTIFDRNDFILWVPLSILVVHGINQLNTKIPKQIKYYYWLFIVFATLEIVKLFV